jgi:hypothetical protein
VKPIPFPEQTRIWVGAPGSEVKDLPAFSDNRVTITCWTLSWPERFVVLMRGRLWLSQLNFGKALQPQKVSAESPFRVNNE